MICPNCECEVDATDRYEVRADDGITIVCTAWYCSECDEEWYVFEDAEDES